MVRHLSSPRSRGRCRFDTDTGASKRSFSEKLTEFAKDLTELLIVHVLAEVLDVDISELLGASAELSLAFFAGLEAAHEPAEEPMGR